MSRSNLISGLVDEVTEWRQHIHANPELGYQEYKTAEFVAAKLKEFGVDEIHEKIATTGIVGVLHGKNGPGAKAIGLRADMDALPIVEVGNHAYKSQTEGTMHACGHDGHTALLLGAAKALAETREFEGTVHFIFQPAEEGGAGGKKMVEEGLFERFAMDEVYGLHNEPGLDVGKFEIRSGPIMAAADEFQIAVKAGGGHAAMPHQTIDVVVVAAQIILAVQALVSRESSAHDSSVLSITQLSGSNASNIIPSEVNLGGTLRTLSFQARDYLEKRIKQVATGIATTMGATAEVSYQRGYPATVNHSRQTEIAADVARNVVGAEKVNAACNPMMAAEDFAYMLEERPGAYIFLGNGDSTACHTPDYNFDDGSIPFGVEYWVSLVETALPTEPS